MRQIFNEVPQQRGCTPEAWRRKRIKVTYKKGDVEEAGNYRPICTLPALYKLFSTLLYNRLYPKLDRGQADNQVGFRRTFQTLDHLATFKLLEQRCREWRIKMWTATVDFAKALDTIKHKALWTALAQFGVESHQISLLKRLHADQKATVLTDTESYVLSSLLFNTVLQAALEDDLARWREKGMGISLCVLESDCLSNLRFADDVLLLFTSLEQLRNLMCDNKKGTENVGLKIHSEKTKILSSQTSNRRKKWRSKTSKWRFCQWKNVRSILVRQ